MVMVVVLHDDDSDISFVILLLQAGQIICIIFREKRRGLNDEYAGSNGIYA